MSFATIEIFFLRILDFVLKCRCQTMGKIKLGSLAGLTSGFIPFEVLSPLSDLKGDFLSGK